MNAAIGSVYEFGPFRVDPDERLVTRNGTPIALTPKTLDMLLLFVRNSGKALGKDEIMKALWPDSFVEEANLAQTVSVLRKALGDDTEGRTYIETIPKRGYRFRPRVEMRTVTILPAVPGQGRQIKNNRRAIRTLWPGIAMLAAAAAGFFVGRAFSSHAGGSIAASRFVPVVSDPGVRLYPSWSPNGKSIAFVGEVNGLLQVFTRTLGSSMSTQITRRPDDCIHPIWSHDGAHILFGAGGDFWSVGANGGEPTLVIKRAWQASLAPDGSALAFISPRPDTGLGELWISSPPGASPKRYSQLPFGNRKYLARAIVRFSPDGAKLGVSLLLRETKPEFWIIPLPAGKPVEVLNTFHPKPFISGPIQFSWMPDSRHIVCAQSLLFVSNPHLSIVDVTNGYVRPLTSGSGVEMTPAVSPDGSRIVFASVRGTYDLVEVPLDGSPIRNFLATTRNEVTPSWSPLGSHVAYATDRGGSREIWLRDVKEGWARPIVTQKDFGSDHTFQLLDICFSPDGQQIAYRRIGESGEAVWISTIAGDAPARLAAESENGYQRGPAWSPDGNWLAYYATPRQTSQTLMKVHIGGNGSPLVVKDGVGAYPRWSPDGRWLLSGDPGLYLTAPDGTSSFKVSDRSYLIHGWSKDGSRIYGVRNTEVHHLVLESIDPENKQEKLISDFGPTPGSWLFGGLDSNTLFRGFSISPDGTSFLTSMFRATSDIWLFENF